MAADGEQKQLVHPRIQTARGHVADEDWAGAEHELALAVEAAKDLEAENERLREALHAIAEMDPAAVPERRTPFEHACDVAAAALRTEDDRA